MVAVRFDSVRTLAAAGISASYAPIGSAFASRVRILKISNDTDGDILISFDGTTDNDFVAAGSFVLYDLTANGTGVEGDKLFLEITTRVHAKDGPTAPTTGTVYMTAVHARGD